MSKKLILHIGLAKTGTTTLQNWLFSNRGALKELNIGYSQQFLHDKGAHHKLPILIQDEDWSAVESAMHLLNGDLSELNTIIISSEELSTLPPRLIDKLSLLLKKIFDEVDVLVTIRPHYSLLIGQYKQQVRTGYISGGLAGFWASAKAHAKFLHLDDTLTPWRQLSNNNNGVITIACTESGIPGYVGDILRVFSGLYCSGVVFSGVEKEAGSMNQSLSSSQIAFVNDIRNDQPRLWGKGISFDHRRFVYFCFQNISEKFKLMSANNHLDIISCERLVFLDCIRIFKNQWLSLASSNSLSFPNEESILEWERNKINKLDANIKQEVDKMNVPQNYISQDDRELLDFLYDFYLENEIIHDVGPSVQLNYLKSKL